MGMCSGKCSHRWSHHLWGSCSRTLIDGLQDCDTTQLLVLDEAGNNNAFSRDEESEEKLFEYGTISQNIPVVKQIFHTEEKAADENAVIASDLSKTFVDMKFGSGDEEKATSYLQTLDLNVYVVTWNMNGKRLVRSVSKLLDVDGERYDLYVIGLQEAHSCFADESIIKEALGEKYSFVAAASMLSLQLFIIAKKTVLPFLSRPFVDKVSTGGLGGLAGRQKGAVAITLRFKEATLLFIACHLAPHQRNVKQRNAQFHRISGAVFARQVQVVHPIVERFSSACSSCGSGLGADGSRLSVEHALPSNSKFVEQADVVVWMGDLNYRVEMSRSSVAFLIRHKLEEVLWSKDQLNRALKRGHAFSGFKEGLLLFKPTYKYDVGTDNYDTSSKERVPSWTDRILYKVGDSSKLKVHLRSYSSINSIKTSDHRPVRALLTLSGNKENLKI